MCECKLGGDKDCCGDCIYHQLDGYEYNEETGECENREVKSLNKFKGLKMDKREGIITIDKLESNYIPELRFSVDFCGFNEGSGSPCRNNEEVKEEVERLVKRHSKEYKLKIVDKRVSQTTL